MMKNRTPNFLLPVGFLFGAATSAYQIEGAWDEDGKGESNWDRWCHTPGKIKGGGTGDVAIDHYHRWGEDLEAMRQLGIDAYRMSIAWSRVMPDGRGALNSKGLAFYDRLFDALLAAGIDPFVTLCHYDIPQALEDRGGWLNRDMTGWFADYAAQTARQFGDRVKHWVTINEPICISDDHYGGTIEPPGLGDALARSQVTHHLLLGHGKALAAIKSEGGERQEVGLVCNLYPVHSYLDLIQQQVRNEAAAGTPVRAALITTDETAGIDDFTAEETAQALQMMDDRINRRWLDPIFLGRYPENLWDMLGHTPEVEMGDMAIIGARPDFLGVNYYSRIIVRPMRKEGKIVPVGVSAAGLGLPVTTMGWEIYPPGLYELVSTLSHDYNSPVFYLTENGMAFDDFVEPDGSIHDTYRINFICDHLEQCARLIAEGVQLKGYIHWSLMDTFEWETGWGQRFGLVYVHYDTLQRTLKDSALWYRNLIRSTKGLQT